MTFLPPAVRTTKHHVTYAMRSDGRIFSILRLRRGMQDARLPPGSPG
jgi:hypothetical protein